MNHKQHRFLFRFEEILAECDEDDHLETNLDKKPKAKLENRWKKVENYLHESEDDILDFTEANANSKILSMIYFLLYLFNTFIIS